MATASFPISRRTFGQLVLGAVASASSSALPLHTAMAEPETGRPRHGLSAFGELKYDPDFAHFAYANPQAPNEGKIAFAVPNWAYNQSTETFDTMNTFVLRGNAPPRMELLYDGLMVRSLDEPDAVYCALARDVTVSPDRRSFTFRLRPEARFSTGEPVRAQDVAFSYETLKRDGHPALQIALAKLIRATATDDETVTLTFAQGQSFQDTLSVLSIPVLPEEFFAGRSLLDISDEIIPGSGRYRVARSAFGRFIEYERRDDYWAHDLPFAKGLDHFQTIRLDFFRERQTALEAFKKGLIEFREEFTAKAWATEYGFPAIRNGQAVQREFPAEKTPRFQCWALNQRRSRFADPRIRRAVNMCFDFEWTNANMFYGLYSHSDSCFENSEFKAQGLPSPAELELLEPLREQVPEEAFGEPWVQPVTDGSGRDREQLRAALELFTAAGCIRDGQRLLDPDGELFRLEFLINDSGFERVYGKFIQTLRDLGIDARFHLADPAQYTDRLNRFDFDLVGLAASPGATPTSEGLRALFGSETRDREGARNYPGVASEAIDALIAEVGRVSSRKELVTAMRALDRVLRARLDWIPNVHSNSHRVAYWDMFGFDETKPDYGWPVERLWWFDVEKARRIGRA